MNSLVVRPKVPVRVVLVHTDTITEIIRVLQTGIRNDSSTFRCIDDQLLCQPVDLFRVCRWSRGFEPTVQT